MKILNSEPDNVVACVVLGVSEELASELLSKFDDEKRKKITQHMLNGFALANEILNKA